MAKPIDFDGYKCNKIELSGANSDGQRRGFEIVSF